MNPLLQAIRDYERAAETLANAAAMAAAGNKLNVTVEDGRELMDRIAFAELLGSRAEQSILESVALRTALEILKAKIKQQ